MATPLSAKVLISEAGDFEVWASRGDKLVRLVGVYRKYKAARCAANRYEHTLRVARFQERGFPYKVAG